MSVKSLKEHAAKIGKRAVLQIKPGFEINVTIEDVRENFGRVDFQVKPVSGYGLDWVSADRVKDI